MEGKEKKTNSSRYYSNKRIRARIDKLLFENAKVQSSLGTDTTEEEWDEAREHTKKIAYQIYEIDKEFALSNFLEVNFKDVL